MRFRTWLAGLITGIVAPFVLVFGGAGIVGIAVEYEIEFLVWAGLLLLVCGLLWMLGLFFLASED